MDQSDPQPALVWYPEEFRGVSGQVPDATLYGKAYWEEYTRRDRTGMGTLLTRVRLNLVDAYRTGGARSDVLDVGIGGGKLSEPTSIPTLIDICRRMKNSGAVVQ
jgi:hypothetical protein